MKTRKERFIPGGVPRYIRVYDNGGKTFDRYTCVFTGRYSNRPGGYLYLGMSANPFHPQGFGQHGESDTIIDRPAYSHLGKKVAFQSLPEMVQKCIVETYESIWNL